MFRGLTPAMSAVHKGFMHIHSEAPPWSSLPFCITALRPWQGLLGSHPVTENSEALSHFTSCNYFILLTFFNKDKYVQDINLNSQAVLSQQLPTIRKITTNSFLRQEEKLDLPCVTGCEDVTFAIWKKVPFQGPYVWPVSYRPALVFWVVTLHEGKQEKLSSGKTHWHWTCVPSAHPTLTVSPIGC